MTYEPERILIDRGGIDAGTAALLKDNNNPMWAMMANGGMNGMWNNPFVYLVWMMFAGRFFNNGEWGGNCGGLQNAEIQSQISALSSQMADNQNSNLLMDAIKGNNAAIGQLASNLNCDFNTLNQSICCVKSAIDNVAANVGFSAERVINAVNMGDCGIITAVKDCCCSTQKEIIKMGYENQLANCNQTNTLVSAINTVNTGLERGFSNIAYETQAQTCQLLNAGNANTQRIIDTLNCHWNNELQQRYNDARLELSQKNQNEYLISQLKTTAAA